MAGRGGGRHHDDPGQGRAGAFPRRSFLKGAAASAGAVSLNLGTLAREAIAEPNAISTENALPGSPETEWGSYEDPSIEGFATDVSVNAGQTVRFKVGTASTDYRIRIYRMGWYAVESADTPPPGGSQDRSGAGNGAARRRQRDMHGIDHGEARAGGHAPRGSRAARGRVVGRDAMVTR